MMEKALKRRQSGPPCVSYPLWPGSRGPVRIIVDGPSSQCSSRRSSTSSRTSRWARRSSEASAVVLGKVVRKGRALCRSLTPEPRSSPGESPEYFTGVNGASVFGFRAKSLSPSKRCGGGGAASGGQRSLGSTDDELDEPDARCHLLVEDEDGLRFSPSPSPRHSLSSAGSGASQASSSKGDVGKKQDQGGGVGGGLAKLARLLMQKEKTLGSGDRSPSASSALLSPPAPTSSTSSVFDPLIGFPGVPSTPLRRSASIDSLLDTSAGVAACSATSASANGLDEAFLQVTPASGHSPRSSAVLPNSPSVPSRLAKGVPGLRQSGVELLLDGFSLSKSEKKKLEKLNKFNIDLQALFAAVEHHHIERARSILESSDVDVNSVNTDGFTALDVAVLTGEASLARLLQSRGATESPRFLSPDARASQLGALLREAVRCVDDLTACVASASANQGSLSNALLKEKERQLSLWKRRLELISEMKAGFEELRPPDPPSQVTLEVVGTHALRVRFTEPASALHAAVFVTKYNVEWCEHEDFSRDVGSKEVTDVQSTEVTLPDLEKGVAYFVRVAAGNAKGFSSYQTSWPPSARPSSWREVEDRSQRWTGRIERLDALFQQVMESRPAHAAEVVSLQRSNTTGGIGVPGLGNTSSGESTETTPMQQRRQMRKSIRQLFAAAPKFQRSLKRGVYLACLFYNEDRILVTTEETLPILEVDDSFPASLQTDFHWMMKVACTWDDVRTLRQDMEKSHSSSNVHFRSKLLQTVEQMQSALGVQDLGQVYYKPLRDYEGTTVLCVVKYVSEPKTVSALSVRWIPLAKIQRRIPSVSDGGELPSASELLVSSLSEMMTYNQASCKPLARGLYLGYLKLKSSMDLISVLVPYRNPNVLPYCRIRDNPHVSCEEWRWLRGLTGGDASNTGANEREPDEPQPGKAEPDEAQLRFQRAVSAAARNLFAQLEVPPELHDAHRLYDAEVVELSEGVSFLLALPPVEGVCSVPGQREELTSRADCLALPVQIFEVIHMGTYQRPLMARYARVSSILETDTVLAQHANREAFSAPEVAAARSRLNQLQDFQVQLDQTWRGMRWIMDALTFARDRALNAGLPFASVWTSSASDGASSSPRSTSPTCRRSSQPSAAARRVSRVDDLIDAKLFLSVSGTSTSVSGGGLEIRRCASASRLVLERPQDFEEVEEARQGGGSVSFDCGEEDDDTNDDNEEESTATSPSVLRVYAAYDSGLPPGTSIKIHVTPETTAREVVELVVRQLNTAVVAKGRHGPLYGDERLADFYLVAVVGARERCLSGDFQPLRLQNPWTKGRLFVRLRSDASS